MTTVLSRSWRQLHSFLLALPPAAMPGIGERCQLFFFISSCIQMSLVLQSKSEVRLAGQRPLSCPGHGGSFTASSPALPPAVMSGTGERCQLFFKQALVFTCGSEGLWLISYLTVFKFLQEMAMKIDRCCTENGKWKMTDVAGDLCCCGLDCQYVTRAK